jgi:DNA-binding IclR family transcriptional regulator
LSVLRLYTIHKAEWTVEEVAREIGVSMSTAYRYVRSLCKGGLLEPFDGAYILGPAIIEYDRQIRMKDPMIRVGQPVMQRLIARSGGTGVALLCRIYRNRVMCIHQEVQSSSINIVSHERGRPMPMFRGASSKVIFANLPSRSVRWFFRKFGHKIAEAGLGSDWETVKARLRCIRKGRVLILRGEVDRSRLGIAAPVFGPNKNVLGSISFVMLQSEATDEAVANVSALVDAAAREIHAGLVNLHAGKLVQPLSSSQDRDSSPDIYPAGASVTTDRI